jgi:endonuclease YncB( thermonuclease family)
MLDPGGGFRAYGFMRALTYAAILAAMWLPSQAQAARVIPDCAGTVEISNATVARVERNGALILSDGRAVMLESIRLPSYDTPLGQQAFAALHDMALSGPVSFTAVPPKEDRYDRVRAQAFGARWFQTALLEQGLAQVQIAPDRNECAPDLYEAESRARARHAGLWAASGSAPRPPQDVQAPAVGNFQLVEGWVTNVGAGGGRVFIDFGNGTDRGGSFSAVIAPEDRRAFRDFDLGGLQDKHIRIRGMVQSYRGHLEIALSNPAQIELLN